jgi:hypothetical protein
MEEIVRRLRPLLLPHEFLENPIDIKHVLIIGRNPLGKYPSTAHSGRLKRLLEESGVQLLTFDSILRMGPAQAIGRRKNVLRHSGSRFAFKVAQADTNLFSAFDKNELGVSDEQMTWFAARGYDMKAWQAGELLRVNDKLPFRRMGESTAEMIRDIVKKRSKRKREPSTTKKSGRRR